MCVTYRRHTTSSTEPVIFCKLVVKGQLTLIGHQFAHLQRQGQQEAIHSVRAQMKPVLLKNSQLLYIYFLYNPKITFKSTSEERRNRLGPRDVGSLRLESVLIGDVVHGVGLSVGTDVRV